MKVRRRPKRKNYKVKHDPLACTRTVRFRGMCVQYKTTYEMLCTKKRPRIA